MGRVGVAVKGVCAICQRTGNTNFSSPPYPLACRPWALLAWMLMRAITTGKIKHNAPEWRSWNLILHAEALPSSLLALSQALCHSAPVDSTQLHKLSWITAFGFCFQAFLFLFPLCLGQPFALQGSFSPFKPTVPNFTPLRRFSALTLMLLYSNSLNPWSKFLGHVWNCL